MQGSGLDQILFCWQIICEFPVCEYPGLQIIRLLDPIVEGPRAIYPFPTGGTLPHVGISMHLPGELHWPLSLHVISSPPLI